MFKNAQPGDILLYRSESKDLIGGLINFFSNLFGKKSNYVHCSFYLGRGQVIHSHLNVDPETWLEGAKKSGVHRSLIPGSDKELIDVFRIPFISLYSKDKIIEFLYQQFGKDYDAPAFPSAFIRSVMGRGAFSDDPPIFNNREAWYCSELLTAAAKMAGITLVPGIHPLSVIPADLGSDRSILKKIA